MKTFVLRLRQLVFGAVTGGVADAQPAIQDRLTEIPSETSNAIRAGVRDALAELARQSAPQHEAIGAAQVVHSRPINRRATPMTNHTSNSEWFRSKTSARTESR